MVPQHAKEALDRYVEDHIPPGGFLLAVLSNDLSGAVGRADSINREHLSDIVKYCYNKIPSSCWGSPEAVDRWLNPDQESEDPKEGNSLYGEDTPASPND